MTEVDGYLFNALTNLRSARAAAKVAGREGEARDIDELIASVVRVRLFADSNQHHAGEVTGD